MRHQSILVVGGSGFIGHAIVAQLVDRGCRVIVPTRRYAHARDLLPLPTVDVVEADVHDASTLMQLVSRCDAVINLVGILHSRPGDPYGPDFARAHVDLPRAIVSAMRAQGVRRFLHMSALGAASDAPSMYLRSKADGEAAARNGLSGEGGIDWTIFRPSVVFGPDDHFINLFAKLARWFPVLPIGGARARFQPIHVMDVARAFVNALDERETIGKTYVLAGPRVYTLRELVRMASIASGHPRPVLPLPDALARLQAWMLEHLPGTPLMSRDNLDSMRVDNVAPPGWTPPKELGLDRLVPLESGVTQTFAGTPEAALSQYRTRARR
ncbi:MAG TPA: complex I NDUFA9 subunit family protein [Burkholderiaceae bacterium]|nr:complex I NDUFA9 subunit family protein [Burkholderiaceae bacterium]